MNQLSKFCFVVTGLVALLSISGCSSNDPEVTKTSQITAAPTKMVTPVIIEEETEKEVDPAVRDSLAGVWKVESADSIKGTSTTENSKVSGQVSIFGENDNDSYLLFKSNSDMFYFFLDRKLNNVDTSFLPNEPRLYKISDKYIELNAKHIKVKYEYQLDGDSLLLKSEGVLVSMVRDHEIESEQSENLQTIINRYKKSLNYVDIN